MPKHPNAATVTLLLGVALLSAVLVLLFVLPCAPSSDGRVASGAPSSPPVSDLINCLRMALQAGGDTRERALLCTSTFDKTPGGVERLIGPFYEDYYRYREDLKNGSSTPSEAWALIDTLNTLV